MMVNRKTNIVYPALCLFLFCSFLLLSGLFVNPFSVNYEVEPNNSYLLFSASTIALLVFWSISLIRKTPRNERPVEGVIAFSICLLIAVYPGLIANEHLLSLFSVVVIYLFTRSYPGIIKWLWRLLFACWLFELCLAMQQALQQGTDLSLFIKGTLHNSGILACYLVIHLPLLFFCLLNPPDSSKGLLPSFVIKFRGHSSPYLQWTIFIMLSGCVLFIVYKTGSRTALVSLLTSGILLLYFNGKTFFFTWVRKLPKVVLSSLILIAISLAVLFSVRLFLLKRPSAIGRIMLSTITFQHVRENFWLGIGWGKFTFLYPQWQALYFEGHRPVNADYFLAASESYLAFNEYLQTFAEIGLIGFCLAGGGLLYFLKARSASVDKKALFSVKVTVISILACGFTSYPLHIFIFLFILALCFSVVSSTRTDHFYPDLKIFAPRAGILKVMMLASILILSYISFFSLRCVAAEFKWKALIDNVSGSRQETKSRYASIYPILRYDGKFLTEYCEYLTQDSSDVGMAVKIIEEAKTRFISERTIIAAAVAYQQAGLYTKSIENYRWWSNYIPNKFTPKFELFKLYKRTGDTGNAKMIGNLILTMPVKVPSPEVERMKYETKRSLEKL